MYTCFSVNYQHLMSIQQGRRILLDNYLISSRKNHSRFKIFLQKYQYVTFLMCRPCLSNGIRYPLTASANFSLLRQEIFWERILPD